MEYHTLYQHLQFVRARSKALDELEPAHRWEIHTPAVAHGFRRIALLTAQVQAAEHAFVHRLVQEIETELMIIKERLSSCSFTD